VDLFIYMDNFRTTGPNAEECWRASRRSASVCNHLGIQDAPRKRREVSRSPGPWGGCMVYTDNAEEGVQVLILRKKWYKPNRVLLALNGLVMASEWVHHKVLERSKQGFLDLCGANLPPSESFYYGTAHVHRWREVRKGQ
jgi:hypothetical protein